MKRELLRPTADVVFKRIFGQEKDITIEFINLFVNPPHPVVDITFLQQEMLADNRDGKLSVVDVRCTDTSKQHFILEMQVVHHDGFLNRQLLYACKAYSQQFLSGINYSIPPPVFLLTIIDHELFPAIPGWLHTFNFRHEDHPTLILNGLELKMLELGKRKKINNFNLDNPLDRWLTFLAEPEKLINMQKFDISVYPNLLKAVELLDRSNLTVAQQIAYDNHLFAVADINQTRIDSFDKGFVEGVEIGVEQGKEIGIEVSISILQDLHTAKLSHEQIALQYSVPLGLVKKIAEQL